MYELLTANTPGCVAFSLPVQRRNLPSRRFLRLSRSSPQPALRAADTERRFRARAASGPRYFPAPGTVQETAEPIIRTQNGPICDGRRALWRRAGPSAKRHGGQFCRQHVQTGRRLMRQTVLPTRIHGIIAPTRSESFARRLAPAGSRSARRQGLRFGLPLTPESGGPSRHRAAQYARALHRARRRQELQNAQQDVDRCHPSGRDPGRCGPRQSRRRI
jgi:hypothetical protein